MCAAKSFTVTRFVIGFAVILLFICLFRDFLMYFENNKKIIILLLSYDVLTIPSSLWTSPQEAFSNDLHEQRVLFQRRIVSFKGYPNSNQINLYLDQLVQDYPDLVTVKNQAYTHENRKIKYIKISKNRFASKNKTIFVEAGIHSREWIASSTALYIIHQLVENSCRNTDLLDQFDWIILPLANPDGNDFTQYKVSLSATYFNCLKYIFVNIR